MSDEAPKYTGFWPILIFLTAFAFSSFYQIAQVLEQHSLLNQQYNAEAVNIPKAKDAQKRLVDLLNDLITTGAKDPSAAQIVREVKEAGIIRDSAKTNAAPATNP
jgi:hypothetical protein